MVRRIFRSCGAAAVVGALLGRLSRLPVTLRRRQKSRRPRRGNGRRPGLETASPICRGSGALRRLPLSNVPPNWRARPCSLQKRPRRGRNR